MLVLTSIGEAWRKTEEAIGLYTTANHQECAERKGELAKARLEVQADMDDGKSSQKTWIRHWTKKLLGTALVVGLVAGGGWAILGDDEVSNETEGDGTVQILDDELIRPVRHTEDKGLEIEYEVRQLGSERTAPGGEILEPAELVSRTFHFEGSLGGEWKKDQVEGPGPLTRSEFKEGIYRQWEEGRTVAERELGTEDPATPVMSLGYVASERLEQQAEEMGFTKAREERRDDEATYRSYERSGARPDGEHYQSLPWRDGSENRQRIEVEFRDEDGLILAHREFLNGELIYSFEVLEVRSLEEDGSV